MKIKIATIPMTILSFLAVGSMMHVKKNFGKKSQSIPIHYVR
ncbi:hypothetical protein [Paenisporosarcina cavernae]|nr:hypothetical protein [Paenisporosarcina cavernae]